MIQSPKGLELNHPPTWYHRGPSVHPSPSTHRGALHRIAVDPERRRAERLVAHRIGFLGHACVWGAVTLFLAVVTRGFVAVVVALAWGVGLAAHGFFGVVAPVLRRHWVEKEVGQKLHDSVTLERRAVEGRHARALEALSASVAHEIRNPVTAVKSLVQQIAEDPTSPANAEYAKIAVGELDRVERAVSHLLRYAREEPLSLRDANLAEVFASALSTMRERLDQSSVKVDGDVPEGFLSADPDKLRRVFINLLSNALDALEDSGFPAPKIEVSGGGSLSGAELWVRVKDNGPGIERERLARIFDPFHTSKASGTGIGLAITRKLVEAHGGRIEVESELGAGAAFLVTLPKLGPAREPR
jgi:signal transduction histidine kinase